MTTKTTTDSAPEPLWAREKHFILRLVHERDNGVRLMPLEQVIDLCAAFRMSPWSVLGSILTIGPGLIDKADLSALHADIIDWICRTPDDVLTCVMSPARQLHEPSAKELRSAFRALCDEMVLGEVG